MKQSSIDYIHTVDRNHRQEEAARWCKAAFGAEHSQSLEQRGIRFLEEAIELAQAAGCDLAMCHKLLDFVFSRPVGDLKQELGGAGLTLLCLASAAGESADAAEMDELARVLLKPLKHFADRNKAKNDAGFNVVSPAYPTEATKP